MNPLRFHWFCRVLCYYKLILFVFAAPGDISRAKCEEYAKYVYSEEYSPVMTRKAKTDKVSQCGIVEVPLVIGGVEAIPKEFPHMAIIGYGNSPDDSNLKWQCGGSLLSEKYILTAAHCLVDSGGRPQKVRVGEVNLDTTDESETQDRLIAREIKYPEYTSGSKYNDIALLELDSPVTFTAYVRPACLNTKPTTAPRAVASGFGKTNFDNVEGSKILMKVTLNVLDVKSCEKFFKRDITPDGHLSKGIVSSQLCVGELKGGKDTCQGDSGGPLQVVLAQPYCMYNIVGVVSFGKFCGFANQPAIYTNVESFVPWIEKIVWGSN